MANKRKSVAERQAQRQRFIKAAREAGAGEDEREFDENLKRITQPKMKDAKKPDPA